MSTGLRVTMNLDLDPWTDLHVADLLGADGIVQAERIGLLPHGTEQGRATVAILARLPDGQQLIVQTTWRLLRTAVQALAASPTIEMEDL